MVNGQKDAGLVLPPVVHKEPALTCHRFYAPVVFPEPDKVVPNRVNINPKMGNFPCIRENCMLWNAKANECYDVTAAKSQAILAEYAFNKINDVHIEQGGM